MTVDVETMRDDFAGKIGGHRPPLQLLPINLPQLNPAPLPGFGVEHYVLRSRAVLSWSFWIKHLQRITALDCGWNHSIHAPLTNDWGRSGSRSHFFPAIFRTISLAMRGADQCERHNSN